MLRYTVKRIFLFVPTLFFIALLVFLISSFTPGDPVEILLRQDIGSGALSSQSGRSAAYALKRKKLGLDLPLFYCSLGHYQSTDTSYRIHPKKVRKSLQRMNHRSGNWQGLQAYYKSCLDLVKMCSAMEWKNAEKGQQIFRQTVELLHTHREKDILATLKQLQEQIEAQESTTAISRQNNLVLERYANWQKNQNQYAKWLPTLRWHGLENQFHLWLLGDQPWLKKKTAAEQLHRSVGFVRGDFGTSYTDGRPVASKLKEALVLTAKLSLIAILFTYLIAIPIGVKTAAIKGSKKEKVTTTLLFMLYAMPNFWIGTLLVTFLCSPDFLNWFPPAYSLMDIPEDANGLERFFITAYHLVLPLFCWTYGSIAYLSKQTSNSMTEAFAKDYITTALAKGLKKKQIIWKHALKNALLPIITLFASIFPLAISGAIALELIFSIPGMGKLGYDALIQRDYPVIYATVMLTAILTLIGFLIADLIYAIADPRISFDKKRKTHA